MTERTVKDPGSERLVISGIELDVSNPSLAASFSGDADASDPARGVSAVDQWTIAQAVPGVVVSLPTMRTDADKRLRQDLRDRVAAAGIKLGFEVGDEGTWQSTSGVTIATRLSERPTTAAAAVHFVTKIMRAALPVPDRTAVLFVVAHEEAAESFTVAIRHLRASGLVRVISIGHLERLAALCEQGSVSHHVVTVMLAPVAGIDVGMLVDMLIQVHEREGE